MVPVTKPMLWGIGNHLGPCSEASDRPEGQEQDGGAAGGQEANLTTNSISASENARDMVLFWGMGNHLGLFSEASDRPEGHEQGGGAVGGQEALQGVKFYLSF